MATFKHGNFSVEFDPTDVDFVEKYEKAAADYNEKIQKMPKTGLESEKIRYICGTIFDVFDFLFGEGTHVKMFGNKKSGNECLKAFSNFVDSMRRDCVCGVPKAEYENRSSRRAANRKAKK